jgi:hypothetical protein
LEYKILFLRTDGEDGKRKREREREREEAKIKRRKSLTFHCSERPFLDYSLQ